MAGEVPFPLAGEGAVLRFKTENLVRLRSKYGAPPSKKPEYDEQGRRIDFFWEIILIGIQTHDPVIMVDLLREGMKEEGGKKPLLTVDMNDLPFPLQHAEEPLQDAIFLARWGMDAKQLGAHLRAEAAKTQDGILSEDDEELDPPIGSKPDSTSSTDSFEPDAEQVSDPAISGN